MKQFLVKTFILICSMSLIYLYTSTVQEGRIVFYLFLVKTLMSLLLEVLFYLFPHLEQRRNEKNRLQICLSFLTPIGLTEFQDSLLLMESGEGGISGSSSAHRGSIDLNSSPTITEEDEEEIQENSEKSVRQRQVEAELHHRRQLEIAEKRASIKEWVDFRIRSEIAKQGGPPLVDPIDNLEEQASIIEQIGPKSKDPTDLINVRRCLSTLENRLKSDILDKGESRRGHKEGRSTFFIRIPRLRNKIGRYSGSSPFL